MINALRNSAVGYRKRGGYGAELYAIANAISDSGGTEADAILGWSQNALNGTGANVFESQAAIKTTGGYAFHVNGNDTPTAGERILLDLSSILSNDDDVKIVRCAQVMLYETK